MLWGVLVATKSLIWAAAQRAEGEAGAFRSQAPGAVGWWIPRGDIDLQGYSYKRPGKIGEPAGETLWITRYVWVNMRSRMGKYAQAVLRQKESAPEGR